MADEFKGGILGNLSAKLPEPPETLPEFLRRRLREVTQQISYHRGQLEPLEAEEGSLLKAMSAIGMYTDALTRGEPVNALQSTNSNATVGPYTISPFNALAPQFPGNMTLASGRAPTTIKQMLLFALHHHFKGHGATPADLRDYLKNTFKREVATSSISPQLGRLRDLNHVTQLAHGRWVITRAGSWYALDDSEPDEPDPEGSDPPVSEKG